MKSRPWKIVGALAVVGALVVLLAFTVQLMRSSSAARRELGSLRDEMARQREETSNRQSQLVTPIAARVDSLSESLKEQAATLADIVELGARVAKLESESVPATATAEPPVAEPGAAAKEPEPAGIETVPATAAPAVEEVVDAGRFMILEAGIPVGIEDFTLRRSGEGHALESALRAIDGTREVTLTQTLTLSEDWQILTYDRSETTSDGTEDVRMAVQRGRVALTIAGAPTLDQAVQTGPTMVTSRWLAPSLYGVVQHALGDLAGDAPAAATALRVDQRDLVLLHVEPRVPVTLALPGRPSLAYGYKVRGEGGTGETWYYVSDGALVAVAVPGRGLFAYRHDAYPDGIFIEPRTLLTMAAPLGVIELPTQVVGRGATLKGTFTIPSAASEKMPAVLLLPDLGPYDRDGDAVGVETKVLRDLAVRLGQQGVASYRLDTRGVAESSGVYQTLTLEELETDALVALITLRANPKIDTANVFVVGVGYGGLVAQRLAVGSSAAGAIGIAVPARSLAENEIERIRRRAEGEGRSPEDVANLVEREQAYWRFVRSTSGTWADVSLETMRAALPWVDELGYVARSSFLPLPLLRDVLDKSPIEAARALQKKALYILGSKDSVVPAADLDLLVRAARDAGNSEVTGQLLDGLNHWLRAQTEPLGSLGGHLDLEVSWGAIGVILDWIAPIPPTLPGGRTGPSPSS